MFVHLPVNHPLRGLYRFLGCVTGLYVLAFGCYGLVISWGHPVFARAALTALGLHTNPAFAVLSIAVGLVVVAAALIGRNVAFYVFLVGGMVFLVSGMAMLAVMQTGLNLLNFNVTTCVVSFVIGLVLSTCGLYTQTASREQEEAAHRRRYTPPATATQRTGTGGR